MTSTAFTNTAPFPTITSTAPSTALANHGQIHPTSHSRGGSHLSSAPQPLATASNSDLNAASGAIGKMSQSQPSSQQSFTMSQPGGSQPYRSYSDAQRLGQVYGFQDEPPQIYSAVYSGVDVYEMEVNGIAVMRRRRDSWLNATQILKVAGVDKGKRTKILEKEIQTGEHEKVQGGYGKYQGTWIRFDRGVEVCRQYGVEDLLRPLLTYDMGQDGGIAGQGDFNTPTKEQAMAAQRKRMYSNTANNDGRTNGMAGTFFKNISSTASNAVAAISKARFDSPGPRGRNGPSRPPTFSRQTSMQNMDDFPGNSQQSFASDYGQHADSAYSTQNTQIFNGDEPPPKRQRVITPADSFGYTSQSMEMYANNFPGSPTEPNESFIYSQNGINVHADEGVALPPLPFDASPEADQKRALLRSLFLDESLKDYSQHEALRTLSPLDLDHPIDDKSHTVLHWAATLARMPLLRALIAAGANPYRANSSGETPLMRASIVTNNSDHSCFPELLDVLGHTIEVRDNKGRTVLHHIAVTSAVKGRNQSSRYYLESLLEWVVRQGSSQPSSQASANRVAPAASKINLGRFMSEIVNAQDKSGDTALNIAARIGNRSIISQLLEVGADPSIANNAGLRPIDFGVGGDAAEDVANGDKTGDQNGAPSNSQQTRESSDEIINSITQLLNETSTTFSAELRKKQTDLESLHASLRATSAQLGEAKRSLEHLQKTTKDQALTKQKIWNLRRGREEEQAQLLSLTQKHGPLDPNAIAWQNETIDSSDSADDLPSAAVLRARIQAFKTQTGATRKAVGTLKGRSKDVEMKYRRVVALCSGVPEQEVDVVIDGLLRAVESEKDGLEIGRVRRFLTGVDV